MLPAISCEAVPVPLASDYVGVVRERGFSGDVELSDAQRTVAATDNSIYQLKPAAILYPRSALDVSLALQVAAEGRFAAISIVPRGGATGTNGQSLSEGVVVDVSRHMNRIVGTDVRAREVRVEAGVVKDQLNRVLHSAGLHFAPELSTSNRATIGGMIATDASGQGSRIYGKTRDHVLTLTAVLGNGEIVEVRPMGVQEALRVSGSPGLFGRIVRDLHALARQNAGLIEARFPRLARQATGYDLSHLLLADGGIDLTALLCGSEGTLAIIVEARLAVVPLPARTALVALAYEDFVVALDDALRFDGNDIASVESMDGTVLQLGREDPLWEQVGRYFEAPGGISPGGVNIVEIVGDDDAQIERRLALVSARLADSRALAAHVVPERDCAAIWELRKRAVGLLGRLPGTSKPLPFIEDTIVPPARLAAYIGELRALLDAGGYRYGMFGHADAGVIHVRPALDPFAPDLMAHVGAISEAVIDMVDRFGGALWGEHGKGFRSMAAPAYFGPLYPLMQQVKEAFDPANQLNPGKVAGPHLTPISGPSTRAAQTGSLPSSIRQLYRGAIECNGNGACFDFSFDSPMCPSWKATRDRRQSPKGRASLMRDWLKRLSASGVDPVGLSASLAARSPLQRLGAFVLRVGNSVGKAAGTPDFSHEVRASMDTCLACSSCSGQCPVKVDIPDLRSHFLELYHDRYLRPAASYLVMHIEGMAPLLAHIAPLYNAVSRSAAFRWLSARAGLVHLPAIPRSRRRLAAILRDLGARPADPVQLAALPEAERAHSVVVVDDALTSNFDSDVLLASVRLLRRLGMTVWMCPPHPHGKALHVLGARGAFRRVAARNAAMLSALARTGVPLVGIDPSLTLSYRTDYPRELGKVAFRVELLQEWLATHLGRWQSPRAVAPRALRLMLHCTERSLIPEAGKQWRRVFEHFGATMEVVASGCCGMAGAFGHETRNRKLSEDIYRLSWEPALRASALETVATGYSCRSQVKIMEGHRPRHPVEVLAEMIAGLPREAGTIRIDDEGQSR